MKRIKWPIILFFCSIMTIPFCGWFLSNDNSLLLIDPPGERILYHTNMNGYAISISRRSPNNIFDTASIFGNIHSPGNKIDISFWMGPCRTNDVHFAEYNYSDVGILLIYDIQMPEYILIAVDATEARFWPDTRQTDGNNDKIGNEIISRINHLYCTRYEIANFDCVKKWR